MFFCLILLSFCLQIQAQKPVLRHSYTFNDGSPNDVVGDAHGIVKGGKITNGMYLAYALDQYVDLPADIIKINNYKSFSLEAFLLAGGGNDLHTMFSYFGNTLGNYGVDYVFQSLCNNQSSVTTISCKNYTAPWASGTDVATTFLQDAKFHHVVTTFDNKVIKFYIDGVLIGSKSKDNHIENTIEHLSNMYAYLGKSGYLQDKTWLGAIDGFNIYEGVLNEKIIAKSADAYLKGTNHTTDKFLSMLKYVPEIDMGFMPENKALDTFVGTYKKSKITVYPTILRTVDTIMYSQSTGKQLFEMLQQEGNLNVSFNASNLYPGELSGRGQLEFFQNGLKALISAVKENEVTTDYHLVSEILFPPNESEYNVVFGINVYILDSQGENAFSFLLNQHHNYLSLAGLYEKKSIDDNAMDFLLEKSNMVITGSLKKQIEAIEKSKIQKF
ncbi:LamG domain-containing protein [Aestuariibaculum sp. M13]|uniref:LamG domain-containing protein n=1 Tax=Aestuariibaculum sp. M13 TaxID=2967132 RepID=UPI002159DBE9|nr:LamG domain-containing protein [Aestuariibaculum sp. M13]MCR8667734.1 LamG domain-containing protein [Aestuariibaculum sp. M13]